jgi:hypothetical protein
MAMYIVGLKTGITELKVFAHHPKLCKTDQWINISEFQFCVQASPLFWFKNILNDI